ncbi:MAG: GIY-YIG nuclease family protein [Flavobacteriales bacterium]|nr:GIY-YIG nuclease family protein [Flavobacteriales bacterium]
MERGGVIYILTNKYNKVLYTGVTSDLKTRVFQHKEKIYPKSFTSKYNIDKLVYYNSFPTIEEAIAEEKRIKGGSRNQKINLIESINKNWEDLYSKL